MNRPSLSNVFFFSLLLLFFISCDDNSDLHRQIKRLTLERDLKNREAIKANEDLEQLRKQKEGVSYKTYKDLFLYLARSLQLDSEVQEYTQEKLNNLIKNDFFQKSLEEADDQGQSISQLLAQSPYNQSMKDCFQLKDLDIETEHKENFFHFFSKGSRFSKSEEERLNTLQDLLKANEDSEKIRSLLNKTDDQEISSLAYLIIHQLEMLAKYYIDLGSDVNIKTAVPLQQFINNSKKGDSHLMSMIRLCQVDVIEHVFTKHKTKVKLNYKNEAGQFLGDVIRSSDCTEEQRKKMSIYLQQSEIHKEFRTILATGSLPQIKDFFRQLKKEHLNQFQEILNIVYRDNDSEEFHNKSPLLIAVGRGDLNIVKELFHCGVRFDFDDYFNDFSTIKRVGQLAIEYCDQHGLDEIKEFLNTKAHPPYASSATHPKDKCFADDI